MFIPRSINLIGDDNMKKSMVILCVIVSMFGFASLANADLMDGLLAYYAFDGNTNDMSGNGNDAINHGANTTEDRFGNPDSAILLTDNYGPYGGGNYVELSDIVEGLNSLTISMWVNEYEIGYQHGESYLMFGVHHLDRVSIHHNRGGVLGDLGKIDFTISNTVEREVTLSVDFNEAWQGEFQHYAMVYDGENGLFQAYLNGDLIGEQSISTAPITTTGNNYAGLGIHWFDSGDSNSTRFNGAFDDVFIYDRALSTTEIKDIYNTANPVPEPMTMLLLVSGLVGLGGFKRKFKKG